MVAEPCTQKMRFAPTLTKKTKKAVPPPPHGKPSAVGILSFEIATAMSRAVHLHRSLSDPEISRLRSKTLASPAIRAAVSSDDSFLLSLAVAEKLDALNRVAAAASLLGRRCSLPALLAFDHIYSDLLAGRIPEFPSKGAAFTRMERLAASTAALHAELSALAELEQSARKFPPSDEARWALDQKIRWQRQSVKLLRGSSLWNKSFDDAGLLLASSVCAIHARIRLVFGDAFPELDSLMPGSEKRRQLSGPIPHIQGPIRPERIDSKLDPELGFRCGASPGAIFMECLSLSSSASGKDDIDDHFENESSPFSGKIGVSRFGPKTKLTTLASPSTVGGSSLALHYANVVIVVEKLLRYLHLVGDDTRDDLYQMLPLSLRVALRKSLKSYAKNLAIYDAPLAHDWRVRLDNVLSWLAPMAHNMIRWQTERNFEQQEIVPRTNVLLLETLYFADREKIEEAICELLVGLNYIYRYEEQQSALLDCSSVGLEDCMDWQMQY